MNILWPIATAISDLLRNKCLDIVDVVGEIMHSETFNVFDVSIADEAYSYFKIWVVFLYVIYDLLEGIF